MRWILACALLALLGAGAWWLLRDGGTGADPAAGSLERAGPERERGPLLGGSASRTGEPATTLAPKGPEPEAASALLLVRVLDGRGEPVPHAEVLVRGKHASAQAAALNGLLRLDAFRQSDGTDASLEGARITAWGAKDGDGRPLEWGVGRAGPIAAGQTEVLVRLPKGEVLAGKVLLEDGAPVAEALVSASPVESTHRNWNPSSAAGRTDAAGAFRLVGLGAGSYVLQVQGGADLVQADYVEAAAGDEGLEIRLRHGARVLVRVVDDRRVPVPGAYVHANPSRKGPERASPQRIWLLERPTHPNGATSPDGTLVLRGLDPTIPWSLRVSPPKGRDDLQPWGQEPWRPADVEIVLARGYVVSGKVVDPRGRAVPKAVVAYRAAERRWREQPVLADGAFRLVHLPAGPVVLRAEPPGWTTGRSPLQEVTVPAGTEGVTLTTDPGVTLVVRIANPERHGDEKQRFLSGSLLERTDRGMEHVGSADEGERRSGRLVFEALAPDVAYTVWIDPGSTEWYGLATDVRAGGPDVVVTLQRGGTISGRVAGPPEGTSVLLSARNEVGLRSSTDADEQGRYAFKGLPPGRWKIYASTGDGSSREAEAEASVGETLDLTLEERVR